MEIDNRPLRIAIVAGEISGDILGSELVGALRNHFPQAHFYGLAGNLMQQCGVQSLFPMESISLVGTEGLLSQASHILSIRRKLYRRFIADSIDLFIGVDVPDFNLTLAERLSKAGVPTVQYVGPTIWALRGYRVHKVARAVKHVFVLFPFEVEYYRRQNIPVTFVGHPFASRLASLPDCRDVRTQLQLPADKMIVALLPGSRRNEVKRLADPLVQSAHRLCQLFGREHICFAVPIASEALGNCFTTAAPTYNQLPLQLFDGKSQQVLAAADMALLASGTAALEAMLLEKPMVVVYKGPWYAKALVSCFGSLRYCALPNYLLASARVPELIFAKATPQNIADTAWQIWQDKPARLLYQGESRAVRQVLAHANITHAVPVIADLLS